MGVWAEIVKVFKAVGVITVVGFAYWYGSRETDRLVITASEAAYNTGKSETEATLLARFAVEKEDVRREADTSGYARGQSELALSRNEDKDLAELLAKAFAILQNPKILAQLSTETAKSIGDASEAFKRDDFAAATALLPPEITYALDSECVEPVGLFTVSVDKRFTVCGSNEVFIVTYIQYGVIDFSINGEQLRVDYARRESFSDNCIVAYERRVKTEEELTAEVRFVCK